MNEGLLHVHEFPDPVVHHGHNTFLFLLHTLLGLGALDQSIDPFINNLLYSLALVKLADQKSRLLE